MTWTPRRFYRHASYVQRPEGFAVTLDDKSIKTPAGIPMILPTERLAQAVADEWQAQEDTVQPHTMPLTQLAATALDRIVPRRDAVLEQASSFASSELLCYRVDQPQDLAERQKATWQPLLDWLAAEYGARLLVTFGIVPVRQPKDAIEALNAAAGRLSDMELTVLTSAMQASGSLAAALALVARRIDADSAFEVSQLEETYQLERWGEDEEACRRRERIREDLRSAETFLTLVEKEAG